MNSAPHKTHLLGLDPFYAGETCYGVGFVASSSSRYQYYWVVITAPPRPAPDLTIVAPANLTTVALPTTSVTGTASVSSGVSVVEVRVDNISGVGTFEPALGTTTWSAGVTLARGQNTIRVRSRGAGGSVITENARTITYVPLGTLSVTVTAGGVVTRGFAGTTQREEGAVYSIVATPLRGWMFGSWSGDRTGAARTLKFTMDPVMNLQANFVVNPAVRSK